jgi:hypothetical protein
VKARHVALAIFVTVAALASTSASLADAHGSLHVVRSAPLTLSGTGFAPRQPVRLTVYALHATTVRRVADAHGRFLVHLPFAVSKCTLWSARAAGPFAGAVTYAAPADRCTAAETVGTGVAGQVTRGPITPVCVAEQPCDAPAPNVEVTISQNGAVVARTLTGADGGFAASVTQGRYTVAIAGRSTPQTVHVAAGHVSHPDFQIDTGIR